MQPQQTPLAAERPAPTSPAAAQTIHPSSPRFFFSSAAAVNHSTASHRRIAIAVDLSDESAYAVKWAVVNYLRPGDVVILLHVRPTSVLYGADWGSICLEVERLGLSAVIMGSRGFGASRRGSNGRLGSVSDYCVHHCVCPVVVVRYPDEAGADAVSAGNANGCADAAAAAAVGKEAELHPVPEEEQEYHDASGGQKDA